MRRRARRRRVLWALISLLVIAGFVLLAWPAPTRHRYSQTVQIGQKHARPQLLTFDAADVTRRPAIDQIVNAISNSSYVGIEIHSTKSRAAVSDAADLVRTTAQVIAPARAQADVAAAAGLVSAQRQHVIDAETRLADWRTAKGYDDPTQQVATLEGQLAQATSTNASPSVIAQIQEQLFDARSAVASYTALIAARDTASAGLEAANAAHTRAVDALNASRARASANVAVSPVTTRSAAGGRPFWPVAVAAILQVVAIIAADVLFLTRTKWVSPYAEETTRDRHKRKKALRQDRRMPLNRARTRTGSGRVAAKPLDLPNIEVHFIGGEQGGQRAVELRDAPGGPEESAQHRPEQ